VNEVCCGTSCRTSPPYLSISIYIQPASRSRDLLTAAVIMINLHDCTIPTMFRQTGNLFSLLRRDGASALKCRDRLGLYNDRASIVTRQRRRLIHHRDALASN